MYELNTPSGLVVCTHSTSAGKINVHVDGGGGGGGGYSFGKHSSTESFHAGLCNDPFPQDGGQLLHTCY